MHDHNLHDNCLTAYSPEERLNLCRTFAATAMGYRCRIRIMTCTVAGFFASVALMPLLGVNGVLWIEMLCFLICVGAVATSATLVCPGCGNPLETMGRFCPECGGTPLIPGNLLFKPTKCSVCGKSVRFGRTRSYKIRACTHCGIVLDEKGL